MKRWLVLGVVAVAVVWFASVFIRQLPTAPELQGTVRADGGFIVLTNTDTRVWTDLDLRLNSDYMAGVPTLRVGDTARIPARQFATRAGVRFDPMTTKPMRLYIRADVDATGRQADAGWSFR